mmetsp:Transcript_12738/g.1142  ORF Transcript_12738/g.1142 Transcript_12738/m.1142 type:complete len:109 (-) Transcript_12738:497-823(-)
MNFLQRVVDQQIIRILIHRYSKYLFYYHVLFLKTFRDLYSQGFRKKFFFFLFSIIIRTIYFVKNLKKNFVKQLNQNLPILYHHLKLKGFLVLSLCVLYYVSVKIIMHL